MNMTVHCPSCLNPIPGSARSCPHCGGIPMAHKRAPYAVASLVLGIGSIVLFLIPLVGILFGIIALVLSRKAVAAARHYPAVYRGGMATGGLTCGIIGLVISTIFTGLFFYVYVLNVQQKERDLERVRSLELRNSPFTRD